MSLQSKIIIQIIASLIISILITILSFENISKIGAKNNLTGTFKINTIDNSVYLDNKLMSKTAISAYEVKDRINNTTLENGSCHEIKKNSSTIIDLNEENLTKYFQMKIISNSSINLIEKCFFEFLNELEGRYNQMLVKIEKNFSESNASEIKINEITSEIYDRLISKKYSEIFDKLVQKDSSNLEEMILFEQYRIYIQKEIEKQKALIKNEINSSTFYNQLNSLKSNKPFELIRIKISQQTFSKKTYNLILFIIIFFLIFVIFNKSLFKIKPILANIRKAVGLN